MSGRGELNGYNEYEPIAPSLGRLTARAKHRGSLAQLAHLVRVERHLRGHAAGEPLQWLGTGGATVAAIPCDGAWLAYTLIRGETAFSCPISGTWSSLATAATPSRSRRPSSV
jgi:hypothetical protein